MYINEEWYLCIEKRIVEWEDEISKYYKDIIFRYKVNKEWLFEVKEMRYRSWKKT